MRCRVSGVSGVCTETKSARSSAAWRSSPRSTISTSISKPAARWATARADAPGADHGEGGAVDVDADPALRLPRAPSAVDDVAVGLDDAPRDGEHERPGEVGRRVGQDVGRVADLDAARRRRLDVDVVEADRVVGHRAQLRRGVDQLGVDPVDEQRQQPLGLGDAGEQRVARGRHVARPDLEVVLGGEALERIAGQLARDEDMGHEPDSRRSRARRAG